MSLQPGPACLIRGQGNVLGRQCLLQGRWTFATGEEGRVCTWVTRYPRAVGLLQVGGRGVHGLTLRRGAGSLLARPEDVTRRLGDVAFTVVLEFLATTTVETGLGESLRLFMHLA